MTDELESFADLLEKEGGFDNVRLAVGDRVEARVIQISRDTVFCELSRSQEGALPIEEVSDEEGNVTVSVGETLEVFVVRLGDTIELGRRLGRGQVDIGTLEAARENGVPLQGTVTGVNKGGLEVQVAGTRGFCPVSQIDVGFVEDPQEFMGKTLSFIVREVKENGRNVVLSRRALVERERKEAARKLSAELQEGQRRRGKVVRVVDFGAFVDLGGIDGLVPIGELAHHDVDKVSELVKVGDEVEVEVRRIEEDPKHAGQLRVSLSMKAVAPDPFDAMAAELNEGQWREGKVVRLDTFGAFVELAPAVQGLVHISEMADRRIGHPREVVSVGDAVRVRVLGVDLERRRISLSLKGEPREEARGAEPRVGDTVTGKVQRIERYGVFIGLGDSGRALLPAAESGTPPGTDLRQAFPLGREVTAVVINVDEQGRVKVSCKALEDAEERAALADFNRSQGSAGSGKGFGTLGDLLAAAQEKKKKRR